MVQGEGGGLPKMMDDDDGLKGKWDIIRGCSEMTSTKRGGGGSIQKDDFR